MLSDLDLTALMQKRSEHYRRLAKLLTPMLQIDGRTPEAVVYALLMDAYRDGGRDMHAAVIATCDDAAKSATS
jgi:hypothetical protein